MNGMTNAQAALLAASTRLQGSPPSISVTATASNYKKWLDDQDAADREAAKKRHPAGKGGPVTRTRFDSLPAGHTGTAETLPSGEVVVNVRPFPFGGAPSAARRLLERDYGVDPTVDGAIVTPLFPRVVPASRPDGAA